MIQPTSIYNGFNNRTDALANAATKTSPAQPASTDDGDHLSNANTVALREALSNTPEIRPEVVERAHKLLVDPNYPPRQIIEQLAKLMVQSQAQAETD